MAKVFITKTLFKELKKQFAREEMQKVVRLLFSLEKQPQKGKNLGNIGGVLIKEVKYEKYRFYCITDGHMLKYAKEDELANLLIKFVRMSEKKDQQKTINEIKRILQSLGFEAF